MSNPNCRPAASGSLRTLKLHCVVFAFSLISLNFSLDAAAAPALQHNVFCGSCRMLDDYGNAAPDGVCVRSNTFSGVDAVCYSQNYVRSECATQSVLGEVRGWLRANSDAPYPPTTTNGYYDDEFKFDLMPDIGWTDTTPGIEPINTPQKFLQYFPPQNVILGNATPDGSPSDSGLNYFYIWGGWRNPFIHVELDSYSNGRGGSNYAWTAQNVLGWMPAGYNAAGSIYWPFDLGHIPVAGGSTTSAPLLANGWANIGWYPANASSLGGTYVKVIGYLWRDHDHYDDPYYPPPNMRRGFEEIHYAGGCNYWLEVHGVDSIALVDPPAVRHTLVAYSFNTGPASITDTQDLSRAQPPGKFINSITPYVAYYSSYRPGPLTASATILSGATSAQFTLSTLPSGWATAIALFDVVWGDPPCTPSNCSGCCAGLVTCNSGTAAGACGAGGAACQTCSPYGSGTNACVNQSCVCQPRTCGSGYYFDTDLCRCLCSRC